MKWLEKWLLREESKLKNMTLAVISLTVVVAIVLVVEEVDVLSGIQNMKGYELIELLLIAVSAFGEEMVFRVIPLAGLMFYLTRDLRVLLLVVLVSSILFALTHNHPEIILLSITGVVLSLSYLKFGGYTGQYMKALMYCGGIHYLVNIIVVSIVRGSS